MRYRLGAPLALGRVPGRTVPDLPARRAQSFEATAGEAGRQTQHAFEPLGTGVSCECDLASPSTLSSAGLGLAPSYSIACRLEIGDVIERGNLREDAC